jgi:hypothetical protein
MTDKAKTILQRMNKRQALKRWRKFSNSARRDRILVEFNRDQLDDVGPIGGAEQRMKVLQEMNSLVDDYD